MQPPLYIDIHTHKHFNYAAKVTIHNLHEDFQSAQISATYSMGLHPWHLTNHEQLLKDLSKYAQQPNVLAIGECGLDRVCDTEWQLQLSVFKAQISLANQLQRPLIIHCVRAFDELLQTFTLQPPKVPVIIHGFNKKAVVATKLTEQGYYLSFGAAIMHDDSAAAIALKTVPVAQFFLETDDADVQIADIYQKAAVLKETTVEAIILQLHQNFKKAFNR